ncbi:MAG: ABC transporter substrate-binding protein, partial [Phycisphaerae bacterium]
MMITGRKLLAVASCVVAAVAGCNDSRTTPADPRAGAAEDRVRAKWGKSMDELPSVELQVVSPHNENILDEFQSAFSIHHAVEHGKRVHIDWRDVGGGSTAVLQYLRNVYARSESAGIDVVWGGGPVNFHKLAAEGILQPMKLRQDVIANIPVRFIGVQLYDPNHLWCGSALSGFGFLYNLSLLKRARIAPPEQWDDLARPECFKQICLADPTQSGSAAAAYEMIVQSAPTWPQGWAKLLAILSNAKKFVDSSSSAADAPGLGEAPIATCIDFYGILRVAEAPDALYYVSPKGQTAFNPDPIGILKNPPNGELAQRFVDFVLSRRGQALWALKVGEKDGPVRTPLGRQPIRRDVYEAYAGKILPRVVNPYEVGGDMKLDVELWNMRFGLLRQLVRAAAIDNLQSLRAAREKLIRTNFEPKRLAEFNRLPENIDTPGKVREVARRLGDKTEAERITTDWQRFFRGKYERLAQ